MTQRHHEAITMKNYSPRGRAWHCSWTLGIIWDVCGETGGKGSDRAGTAFKCRGGRSGMEGKGGGKRKARDDEEKFSWHVYCWQSNDAHSVWDLISCQIGKAMAMWELQESQRGLNLARHWDLIKTQSHSPPELTHTGPRSQHFHSHATPSHSLVLHQHRYTNAHVIMHTQTERH